MCVHATQGVYIVLAHTWSASTGILHPPRVPCTVYTRTALVQGSTTARRGPSLLRPLERTLCC